MTEKDYEAMWMALKDDLLYHRYGLIPPLDEEDRVQAEVLDDKG